MQNDSGSDSAAFGYLAPLHPLLLPFKLKKTKQKKTLVPCLYHESGTECLPSLTQRSEFASNHMIFSLTCRPVPLLQKL